MKKIICLLVLTCLFTSCGDDNNDRVGISEITYTDGEYPTGIALHNGVRFTGTVVSLSHGDNDNKDKTLGLFAEELSFYKDGLLYRIEEHSTRDTLLQDFKMKNGDVYKISKLLDGKVDSDSLIYYYNRNGTISEKSAVIWKDGKYLINGIHQSFNDDGKLFQTILYDKGKEKLGKQFDDNGKLVREILYDNEGRTKRDFDENGKLVREIFEEIRLIR